MANNPDNQYVGSTWDKRGQSWVEYNEIMDQRLESVSDVLFNKIGSPSGQKFLDIGCGAGSTTRRMANIVSPNAHVTGIDISNPMLSLAKEKATSINNVEFILADAQTHEFKFSKFDGAISRFGVMFFKDPIEAFKNIRGALKRGGFLTFVCWPPREESEHQYLLSEAAIKLTGIQYNDTGTAPGPQAFSDKDYVKGFLESSGFSNVSIETVKTHIRAKITPDQDARLNMEIGCASRVISEATIDEQTREKIYSEFVNIANDHQKDDYVGYDIAVHVVSAIA